MDLFVHPGVTHRLCFAVRFNDAFTQRPVGVPLVVDVQNLPSVVGMPRLPWEGVHRASDATYRFLVRNNTVAPLGPISLRVVAPHLEYADREPTTVALPRPFALHPPTPDRSDFLVEANLWPTRRLALAPSETALVGRVESAGATPVEGLRVFAWRAIDPMPATPYAYTDEHGDFVFRLPGIKKVVGGAVVSPPTFDLSLAVFRPPAWTVVPLVSPGLPLTVRLGAATTQILRVA